MHAPVISSLDEIYCTCYRPSIGRTDILEYRGNVCELSKRAEWHEQGNPYALHRSEQEKPIGKLGISSLFQNQIRLMVGFVNQKIALHSTTCFLILRFQCNALLRYVDTSIGSSVCLSVSLFVTSYFFKCCKSMA